ncbi:3' exoribonuclease family, domain 1 containing protein [Babesia caballi]|uniref:3' exoribonuclease family, domain 1 containing protein n=1 Tax=Babesia caballi TaxID=5871 RepID=A0AAV4M517_BABCB|nr:3' exoribonuclease family, domain 1 containing protein [Babesia caballi]
MKPPNIEQLDFLLLTESDNATLAIAQRALHKAVRIDGRRLVQSRNVGIEVLQPPGHVIVSFGNTKVFAAVAAEIVEPNPERPNEGILSFHVEISPMCSNSYEPGRQTEQELEIAYAIEKVFKESGAVDVESLCIAAGTYVWCLRTHVHVLQTDGNLLDACDVAVLSALLTFRKPDTVAKDGHGNSIEVDTNYSSPLKLYHTPLLISVGLPANQDHVIVDTNAFEERFVTTHVGAKPQRTSVTPSQISFLFNQFGDLFSIQKHGGEGVDLVKINQAIEVSAVNAVKSVQVGKGVAVALYKTIMEQLRKSSGGSGQAKPVANAVSDSTRGY